MVKGMRGSHKLVNKMHCIGSVWSSDSEINQTPNELSITSGIRKELPISRMKFDVGLQRTISYLTICETSTGEKIISILGLGQIVAIRGRGHL